MRFTPEVVLKIWSVTCSHQGPMRHSSHPQSGFYFGRLAGWLVTAVEAFLKPAVLVTIRDHLSATADRDFFE